MTVTALVAVAVAVLFVGLISFLGERHERRIAGRRLLLARRAFEHGDVVRTLQLLDDAFFVPALSRYDAPDAKVALQAMCLLTEVLEKHQQQGAVRMLAPLREALEEACDHGGKVPDALTQPVKRYLHTVRLRPMLPVLAHGHT